MRKTTIVSLVFVIGCGSPASGTGPDAGTECEDVDGDGVTTCDGDCDDGDALVNPSANELCGDDIDNNCDMQADEGCNGLGTFVSTNTGDDTNPGTKALPVKTIGAGMINAAMIGNAQSVIVAQGTYAEKVTLVEGIDLLGGFQCDTTACDWTRDSVANDTIIANTDYLGVVAGAGITQATLLEGFHILGKDGVPTTAPGSVGVSVSGGSPTLRGNRIFGGAVTGGAAGMDRSIALSLRSTTDPAGVLVQSNTLTGGTAISGSAGLAIEREPVSPAPTTVLAAISNNTIIGGSARRSVGLVARNTVAGTVVIANAIYAGNSMTGASHGVEISGTITIDRNQINVDQTMVGTCTANTQWCTGIMSQSSTSVITNNIVFGPKGSRSAAVFLGELEVAAGAVIVNGNTLNGGGSGSLSSGTIRSESAAVVVTIGQCNTCGFNGFVGKVRNNILDGGANQNRYGVREDPVAGRTMRAEALQNNLFWFTPGGMHTDVLYRVTPATGLPTDHTTLAAVNAMTTPPATANLLGDPLMDGTWHLGAGSVCTNAGTATEAPPVDFDGEARPSGGGVDIGHDETP